MGISYIKNEISEKMWKNKLSRRRKKQEYNEKMIGIYTTFVSESHDIIYKILDALNNNVLDIQKHIDEWKILTTNSYEVVISLNKVFGYTEKTYFEEFFVLNGTMLW